LFIRSPGKITVAHASAKEAEARGYEVGKGQFLLVEDEELEAIEIESTHTIDIDSFVPRSEIDQR
jgi:DNA end-binding protein Ku